MDQAMQIAGPLLGIVAVAVVTFYTVSFNEIREKSLRDLESESEGGFESSLSSRKRRARRKADKQDKF